MTDRKATLKDYVLWLGVPIALCIGLAGYKNGYYRETRIIINELREKPGIEMKVDEVKPQEKKKGEYRTSQEGLDLIKSFEGYSAKPYLCPAGKRTIGYGHLIKEGENYSTITEQEAENLLRQDVQNAENAVKKNVKVELSQGQYDALVSFVYNLGEGNLRKSTLLKKLNERDYQGASQEFGRWVKAGGRTLKGLENRRAREKEMFSSEK